MTPPQESSLKLAPDETPSPRRSDVNDLFDAAASSTTHLPSPSELCERYPLSLGATERVLRSRALLNARIQHGEGAPVAIVGPCSIHCEAAALDYAERIVQLKQRLGERVQLVMRVYFEKPRTTVGWKGFLYDPDVDGSHDIEKGLRRARALMVQIAELGVPIATEILDPLVAEYLEDCVSWVAIGARTSESQIHRQMASGLGCAVGFKNSTDGSVTAAVQASQTAEQGHTHLGIDRSGRVAIMRTVGNPATHVVLRGGAAGPNYDRKSVSRVAETLRSLGRRAALLVDCSHGNSEKDYRRQPEVARAVISQMGAGPADVMGLMLESHLCAGSQPAGSEREYGVSITDGCIDFSTTEALVLELADAAEPRIQSQQLRPTGAE